MSLDTKDKLLTGRKLLKMTLRPGFFNSGKTKASFQISEKHPDCNELLTIFVRTGRRSSHLLTSVDGLYLTITHSTVHRSHRIEISYRAFPKRVGPRVLSLESVDYWNNLLLP